MTVPTSVMMAVLAAEAIAIVFMFSMARRSVPPHRPGADRAIAMVRYVIRSRELAPRHVDAMNMLEIAERNYPDDPRIPALVQEMADALREEGTSALRAGEPETAIELLKYSLHLRSDDPATTAQLQAAQRVASAIDAGRPEQAR